jgi:Na+-driven multidrug efflux pump
MCMIGLQASQLFNHALFLAVTFGVVICILMETLAPQLLALMGTGPEYLKPALVYLRIRALSGTHSTYDLL